MYSLCEPVDDALYEPRISARVANIETTGINLLNQYALTLAVVEYWFEMRHPYVTGSRRHAKQNHRSCI
jgi:hypothetical protein